jgi:hypothetical protein
MYLGTEQRTSGDYRLTSVGLREPALNPGCWDDAGMRFAAVANVAGRRAADRSPASAVGAGVRHLIPFGRCYSPTMTDILDEFGMALSGTFGRT